MSIKEQIKPKSSNSFLLGFRLSIGLLAVIFGLEIAKFGKDPGKHWLLIFGVFMLILGIADITSSFIGLKHKS